MGFRAEGSFVNHSGFRIQGKPEPHLSLLPLGLRVYSLPVGVQGCLGSMGPAACVLWVWDPGCFGL